MSTSTGTSARVSGDVINVEGVSFQKKLRTPEVGAGARVRAPLPTRFARCPSTQGGGAGFRYGAFSPSPYEPNLRKSLDPMQNQAPLPWGQGGRI
jgi:hypothetical protein